MKIEISINSWKYKYIKLKKNSYATIQSYI